MGCDGATGAHRLSGVRPVEHGRANSNLIKNVIQRGSRGLAPLGLPPHWGREGVTIAISSPQMVKNMNALTGQSPRNV